MIGPSTNVSKCSQNALEILYLDQNTLSCSIPESIGRLTNLRGLDLSFNELTDPIPEALGKLISLQRLDLSYNQLNGYIPESLGRLTALREMILKSNRFTGHVPVSIGRLTSLRVLSLKVLVLTNASISGPLPTWFRLLPIIYDLDLSHNKLTGPLTNLPSVYEVRYAKNAQRGLRLQDNLLRGLIPRQLCKRTDLEILDLSRNRLTGKIPKCLWNHSSLRVMLLGSNRLSGVIPSSLGYNYLEWLQLNDNNFSGEFPRDLGYLTGLIVLDLGENKFSGSIPEMIGDNITRLIVLRLHKNNFTGRIPRSLCKCAFLQVLDLAHNNLIESIPHCFGELESMKENPQRNYYIMRTGFDFSSGDIMQVLKGVALVYTKTLQFVINMDLSSNKLDGEIPGAITTLDTLTLTDPSIYADNTYLCGAPLPKECSPHTNPPTATSKNKHENTNKPNKVWFYLDIMSGFATGFWGIIGVLFLKKQWRYKLYMLSEVAIDKIYVAVAIRVSKMKRGIEAA
ncbi:hypothetical protein L1987_61521 [Smallanthus sonchifolius]|uniref:Uncharacterized protein n=1 Tax=Smallanthus sonchifolius TaxID=185202 RepID=A0ACB9C7S5_9ASTR|nr:hypothetical protein L1987_61521 [Smallanthus sonchifolius]